MTVYYKVQTEHIMHRRALFSLLRLCVAQIAVLIAGLSNFSYASGPISEELRWTIGQTTVAATITMPGDSGLHPAVVFIPGSGPTDRNWNSPVIPGSNGSAALLAAELTKAGFITIRYDKRFTGPYAAGNWPHLVGKLSMQGHVDEIDGTVSRLRLRKDVDQGRIFALTNSEGAIHAFNYQLQAPAFAGLVLTAPPGRIMADLMRGQIEAKLSALALPNVKEIMASFDELVENYKAGKPADENPVVPELENTRAAFYDPQGLPYFREFLTANPAALFSGVDSPALVVIGKKDIQVDWQLDGSILEKASAGRQDRAFNYPANANHVLKYEAKAKPELTFADIAYYNADDKVLDPETVKAILDWLTSQSRRQK